MQTFTINFQNNSNSSGSFCVFQQNPDSPNPGIFPLAWRAERASPHSQLRISWNTDLYYFWGKTGALMPGVIFYGGEAIPTSLSENNDITLTKENGNYKFVNQRSAYQQGVLVATSDATTPVNQASIGIGMSGAVSFAVQAQPNMTFQFAPRFEYWVTFGEITQGQVLEPSGIGAAKVEFPHGIFSMNATLNPDNTWTITQGMD